MEYGKNAKTLASLNLKKGDTIFIYKNWNGDKEETLDFYVQKYTIHSIGKVRCYLIEGANFSKKEYDSQELINVELTEYEAIKNCFAFIPEYVENQRQHYLSRIESCSNNKNYCDLMNRYLKNVTTAQCRILINPASNYPNVERILSEQDSMQYL